MTATVQHTRAESVVLAELHYRGWRGATFAEMSAATGLDEIIVEAAFWGLRRYGHADWRDHYNSDGSVVAVWFKS